MANLSKIALVQTPDRLVNQLQQNINSQLNQIIANPIVSGNIINNVVLAVGDNTINHMLGRNLQGWIIILKSANSNIFDKQSTNSTPNLTLVLNSSGIVTISLYVF